MNHVDLIRMSLPKVLLQAFAKVNGMQSKQWRSRIPGQKLSVSIPIHLSGSCLAGVFKPGCMQYRLTHNTFLSQSNVTHLSGVAGKLCHNNADWLMALQE